MFIFVAVATVVMLIPPFIHLTKNQLLHNIAKQTEESITLCKNFITCIGIKIIMHSGFHLAGVKRFATIKNFLTLLTMQAVIFSL